MANHATPIYYVYHGPENKSPHFGSGDPHLLSPRCSFIYWGGLLVTTKFLLWQVTVRIPKNWVLNTAEVKSE